MSVKNSYEILMSPFYPCIKYKIPADQELEGSDHFIVAESMHLKSLHRASARSKRSPIINVYDIETHNCSLSVACENDQKAFYKLTKDCSQIRIHLSENTTRVGFRFLKAWFILYPEEG